MHIAKSKKKWQHGNATQDDNFFNLLEVSLSRLEGSVLVALVTRPFKKVCASRRAIPEERHTKRKKNESKIIMKILTRRLQHEGVAII